MKLLSRKKRCEFTHEITFPWLKLLTLVILMFVGSDVGSASDLAVEQTYRPPTSNSSHAPLLPMPKAPILDNNIVALGYKLFHDTRLSKDNTVACASCHNLKNGGDDERHGSVGVSGKVLEMNSPTVFNISLNFSFFWDGRALSLEDQMDGPIHNPDEMATSWPKILQFLRNDASYGSLFDNVYEGEISERTVKNAISVFEQSLITTDSKFDRFLEGNEDVFNSSEMRGYKNFVSLGCVSCHQGALIGGNLYQQLGVFEDYFYGRANNTQKDFGRFNVTGREEDKYYFKVPSLRNVALTAPYLHDGSIPTLEEIVDVMAYYQLGLSLNVGQSRDLIAFLKTLTGRHELLSSSADGTY